VKLTCCGIFVKKQQRLSFAEERVSVKCHRPAVLSFASVCSVNTYNDIDGARKLHAITE